MLDRRHAADEIDALGVRAIDGCLAGQRVPIRVAWRVLQTRELLFVGTDIEVCHCVLELESDFVIGDRLGRRKVAVGTTDIIVEVIEMHTGVGTHIRAHIAGKLVIRATGE